MEEVPEKKKKRKKSEEKPTEIPKPEPSPPLKPKLEAAPPPTVAPPKLKPLVSIAEEIYEYLKKHDATSPLRIARDLNLDPLAVMKGLRELKAQGKIELQVSSIETSLKYRMERSLAETKKKTRALKKPFDLT